MNSNRVASVVPCHESAPSCRGAAPPETAGRRPSSLRPWLRRSAALGAAALALAAGTPIAAATEIIEATYGDALIAIACEDNAGVIAFSSRQSLSAADPLPAGALDATLTDLLVVLASAGLPAVMEHALGHAAADIFVSAESGLKATLLSHPERIAFEECAGASSLLDTIDEHYGSEAEAESACDEETKAFSAGLLVDLGALLGHSLPHLDQNVLMSELEVEPATESGEIVVEMRASAGQPGAVLTCRLVSTASFSILIH